MCCGRNRMSTSQTRTSPPVASSTQPGQNAAGRQRSHVAYFQYSGKTAMTVIGPVCECSIAFPLPAADCRWTSRPHCTCGRARPGAGAGAVTTRLFGHRPSQGTCAYLQVSSY